MDLLPLGEVQRRLRIVSQSYLGVRSIEVSRIVGSLDRTDDFDRQFRPRREASVKRLESLRLAFPEGDFPPIEAYVVEHVVQHQRQSLGRLKGVQDDGERRADRVGAGLLRSPPATCQRVALDDWSESARWIDADVIQRHRTTIVITSGRVDPLDVLGPVAAEPDRRVLHDVVGLRERAQHPVGDGPQTRSLLLELGGQVVDVVHTLPLAVVSPESGEFNQLTPWGRGV